jgi:hypothetical protein
MNDQRNVLDELDSQPRGPTAEVKRRTAKLVLQGLKSLAIKNDKNERMKKDYEKQKLWSQGRATYHRNAVPNQAEGYGVPTPILVDLPKEWASGQLEAGS